MWGSANNYGMRRHLPGQGFDPGEYASQGPQSRHNYGHVGAETIGVNSASMVDDTLDFNLNPKTGAYETAAQMNAKKPGFWGGLKGRVAGMGGGKGKLLGMAGTAANLAMPAMMFAPMFMGGGDSGGGGGEAPLSSVDIRNLDYNREMQRQLLLSQSVRGF